MSKSKKKKGLKFYCFPFKSTKMNSYKSFSCSTILLVLVAKLSTCFFFFCAKKLAYTLCPKKSVRRLNTYQTFETGKGIFANTLLWSLSSPKLEIGGWTEMLNFLSISLCRIDPYGWYRIHLRTDTHKDDVDHFTTWNLRSAHVLAIVGDSYHSCSGMLGFLWDFLLPLHC